MFLNYYESNLRKHKARLYAVYVGYSTNSQRIRSLLMYDEFHLYRRQYGIVQDWKQLCCSSFYKGSKDRLTQQFTNERGHLNFNLCLGEEVLWRDHKLKNKKKIRQVLKWMIQARLKMESTVQKIEGKLPWGTIFITQKTRRFII